MQILPSRNSPCLSVSLDLVKDLQVSNGALPCRPQLPRLDPRLCSSTGLGSPSPEACPQPLPVGLPAHPACRLPSLTDHGPRDALGPSGAVRHPPASPGLLQHPHQDPSDQQDRAFPVTLESPALCTFSCRLPGDARPASHPREVPVLIKHTPTPLPVPVSAERLQKLLP